MLCSLSHSVAKALTLSVGNTERDRQRVRQTDRQTARATDRDEKQRMMQAADSSPL